MALSLYRQSAFTGGGKILPWFDLLFEVFCDRTHFSLQKSKGLCQGCFFGAKIDPERELDGFSCANDLFEPAA